MPTFKYSVMSRDGKKVNGVIEGFNELDAVSRLKENYPIVLNLSEVKEKGKAAQFLSMDIGGNKLNDKAFTLMCSQFSVILKAGGKLAQFMSLDIGGNKLNDKAFTLMCSQFSVILKAGIPISRTVELIADKMTDKPLKRILEQVAKDVEGGRSLATAFTERGRKLFPVTFLETVRAGEESGSLDTAFDSISKHYAKQSKMKGKVRGALIYPIFVLIVAIVVVVLMSRWCRPLPPSSTATTPSCPSPPRS